MILTFTGYDQSQECAAFFDLIRKAQGWCDARYSKRSLATIEIKAFVPDQPELIPSTPPKP